MLHSQLRKWVVYSSKTACSRGRRFRSTQTQRPFDVLFLGRDEFSVAVLDQLYNAQDVWSSITIATHPDEKTGRGGSKLSESPLKLKAAGLKLETHFIPKKKGDFREWLPPLPFRRPSLSSNPVIITASFGRMIPDSVLHLFSPSRRLNVHPSLIPLYRGPAPIQHAIADGREETGVTILEMKEKRFGADVGDIWAQKPFPIPRNARYEELRDVSGIEGGKLLAIVLRDLLAGKAQAVRQDGSMTSRAPFITQETALVNFNTWDATKLERMNRAIGHQKPLVVTLPSSKALHLFEPEPYVQTDGPLPKPLQALRTPGDATYDPIRRVIVIRCANNTFASVPFLQQQDKKRLEASEWWKGVWPQWLTNKVLRLNSESERGAERP